MLKTNEVAEIQRFIKRGSFLLRSVISCCPAWCRARIKTILLQQEIKSISIFHCELPRGINHQIYQFSFIRMWTSKFLSTIDHPYFGYFGFFSLSPMNKHIYYQSKCFLCREKMSFASSIESLLLVVLVTIQGEI